MRVIYLSEQLPFLCADGDLKRREPMKCSVCSVKYISAVVKSGARGSGIAPTGQGCGGRSILGHSAAAGCRLRAPMVPKAERL